MNRKYEETMRALRQYPKGVSTRDLAARLSIRMPTLSSRLSKYFLYGGSKIDREEIYVLTRKGAHKEYVWRTKL